MSQAPSSVSWTCPGCHALVSLQRQWCWRCGVHWEAEATSSGSGVSTPQRKAQQPSGAAKEPNTSNKQQIQKLQGTLGSLKALAAKQTGADEESTME
eukprot:6793830-Pyramimonas_sp.AAC.1